MLGAIPRGLGREEWLQALPRALVAGFVKTDKEFQSRGMEFKPFQALMYCFDSFNCVLKQINAYVLYSYDCLQERLLEQLPRLLLLMDGQ